MKKSNKQDKIDRQYDILGKKKYRFTRIYTKNLIVLSVDDEMRSSYDFIFGFSAFSNFLQCIYIAFYYIEILFFFF